MQGFTCPINRLPMRWRIFGERFLETYGTFNYTINRGDVRSRGMTGAGILALGHAGFHNSMEAKRAARRSSRVIASTCTTATADSNRDRYHYSLFMCCQGMYQMGSPYWEQFFPRTVRAVLAHQQSDGSWDAERYQNDRRYGNSYTTALVLLAVGAPNQLLPIFQR